MAKIREILVPVDFSEPSGKALDYALEMGNRFDAHIRVLHVLEPPLVIRPEIPLYTTEGTALSILLEEAAHQTERFVAARLGAEAALLDTEVVQGVPYDAIVSVARERAVDLIVMGTRGRSGLAHFFLGSVAEKVVRHAHCPVLTIRDLPAPAEPKA